MTANYPTVAHVVATLKATHQPGDLYRGQTRDYPVMIPSFFRPLATDLTVAADVAAIDETALDRRLESRQQRVRFDVMNQLIEDFGTGLGNVIAQQYGVSSEALDLTDNIDIAAWFATRTYPSYNHEAGPGTGVIYRFRGLTSDGLDAEFSLADLAYHFEAGQSDVGYYDFFIPKEKMGWVLDRERWWWVQPPTSLTVWTARFVTDWPLLRRALALDGDAFPSSKAVYLPPYVRSFRWDLTRFASQAAGMIRPRIFWSADTPSRYDIAKDPADAEAIRLRTRVEPPFTLRDNPKGKWPLVIPSSAVKRHIIGVENLRSHPACEAFLFDHSDTRVTGFYRRVLWPEPADDPLYGRLWQLGIAVLSKPLGFASMPAVDDPEQGIFDRGYRLLNERQTRDARDDADLNRGQLEDATENRTYGPPRAIDCLYQATPLLQSGDINGATRAAIAGLRLEAQNPDLLLALYQCFTKREKTRWASRALDKALLAAPTHSWLLYSKAMELTRLGEVSEATRLLEIALENFDEATYKTNEFYLLELRAVLAWVQWDIPKLDEITDKLRNRGYSAYGILPQVEWLIARFPKLQPPER